MRQIISILLLTQCLIASAFNSRLSVEGTHDAISVEEVDSIHLYRVPDNTFTFTINLKGIEDKSNVNILLNETAITDTTLSADSIVSYTLNAETLYDIKGLEYPCCVYGANYKPVITVASGFVPKTQFVNKKYQQSELPYSYCKDTTKIYTPTIADTIFYTENMGRTFPQLTKEDIEKRGIKYNSENQYYIDSIKNYYRDSILLSHIRIFNTGLGESLKGWNITGVCYIFPNGTDDSTVIIRKAPTLMDENTPSYSCTEVQLCPLPIQTYTNKEGKKKPIKRNVSITYYTYDYESESNKSETISDKQIIFDLPTTDTKMPYEFTETIFGEEKRFASDTIGIGLSVNPTATLEEKIKHNREDEHGTEAIVFATEEEDGMQSNALSTPFKIEMFGNPSPTAGNYEWHFAYDVSFNGARVVYAQDRISMQIEFNKTMKQYIMFKAKNLTSGCTTSKWLGLSLAKPELYVPNIFTPGMGSNEEFFVSYTSIKKYHIVIYNTFGKKMYESEDITKGWDGTYKGRDMANGAYYYVISATDADGKEINKKGTVNLFRKVK